MRLRHFISLAVLTAALHATAQSECSEFWKSAARASDARFKVNGQSTGASVQVGVPTELNIIIYKGQDYRISAVYNEKVLGDHVVIRLVEKVRAPKKQGQSGGASGFEDVRKVIWDNQEHEMADAVEFTATSTKRLAIEVTAPGAPEDPKDIKRGRAAADIGCLGILIEHMATPTIGF